MIGTAIVIGGVIGATAARRVQMTKMPELVALMHSLVGISAVLIAVAALYHAGEEHTTAQKIELFIGAFIGAITFTASLIAFGKLSGKVSGKPISFGGQHLINLLLALAMLAFGLTYFISNSPVAFLVMVAIALILGVTLIIPIGGADMPVVISMLNSYSGWAAAGIGFTLNNSVLIIAGSCVGSSGAILSYIMCKAMNRSIIAVLLGGFGAVSGGPAAAQGERPYKTGSAEDAAFLMSNADTVIIVPGYGLAVARAQHALKELSAKLTEHGVTVKYAIHPVAGRMPGHMNVLLAEAEVPYDQVAEMDDINGEFGQADVVLVLGANDVVNPAAKTDPTSPIAGMPILEAYKAKTIIVNKRSMAAGYAGLDNDLFYMDKTMMVFGDAKKVVEDMVKAVE
jgi:NAD(P) transhydrogenase subunit beta